jgi:outer membrane protein assembly factor BamB
MVKKLLIAGAVAVVCVGLLLFLFLRKNDMGQLVHAAEAVPPHAILFIDQIDYTFFTGELSGNNQLWNEFRSHQVLDRLDSVADRWTDRLERMPLLTSRLQEGALSISLHLQGKSNHAALFYITLDDKVSPQQVDSEIRAMAGNGAEINTRKYEAVELTDVSFGSTQGADRFSYVLTNGLFIAGNTSILLEDAIRSLHSGGGIWNQEGFRIVAETAGKYVLGNVYLNYDRLDELFFPLVEGQYQRQLSTLSGLAEWGEFDLDLHDDAIILSGMTYANDSLENWMNIFSNQSPVKMEATSFVPSNVSEFQAFGISDVGRFIADFRKELRNRDLYRRFQVMENESKRVLGQAVFDELLGLISDEIAWFTLENQKDKSFHEVVILEARSRSEAMTKMTTWVSVMAGSRGKELSDYTSRFVLDNEVSFDIYSFPEIHYDLLAVRKLLKTHFAFYDNYIILSDSEEAVSRTIYQNVLHKTLENEIFYQNINNLMSTRANFTCFIRPEKYLERKNTQLNRDALALTDSISATLRKLPGIIIQFSSEEGIFYSNLSLSYSSKIKEKALTVWESLLDSTIITKPWLVTNHYTSEKEIMVQDASHALYLVNSTGRVLWQVPLDGPVLSDVYQVDYYANGKLQYLFNTPGSIHLVDRNGNYVERYPVKLRAGATNGMSLFDYDNRKEYRIFVACSDRRVYAYDLEGNTVPGWTFRRSEGTVRQPVQHFRIGEKDYIVFSDGIRAYFLDRRGKERLDPKEPLVVSENNQFYLDMNIAGDNPRLVTTDSTGNVIGVSIKGKIEQLLAYDASPGHYFLVKDLDQDGQVEMIYVEGNELKVMDLSGRRVFSYKTKNDIGMVPDIYEFSSTNLKLGLVDKEKNQIYLLNSDGTMYEGFPLEGNTRFSIGYFAGSDSRFNLIVGSLNGFLYNYSIE